ncbi:MAG: NRDE family protein [Porticoccaceae bacterium]|jgi:uncharacterized protein with NRDE domain
MCLLVFARNRHPDYPLVVVANRDEFHRRPSQQAHWWPQCPSVLAGRDLEAGGTWMGVDTNGRWAAVTNYREGKREPAPRSRGELPADYLTGRSSPEVYASSLAKAASAYAGFNLLVGDLEQVCYFSNRKRSVETIPDGIHTLSNHLLNTPWPKAELARLKLAQALRAPSLEVETLFAVLADSQPFDDHELPVTGVGLELERTLSPPFIVGEEYGTRGTTVLMMDKRGQLVYAEQGFLPGGARGELMLQEFSVNG